MASKQLEALHLPLRNLELLFDHLSSITSDLAGKFLSLQPLTTLHQMETQVIPIHCITLVQKINTSLRYGLSAKSLNLMTVTRASQCLDLEAYRAIWEWIRSHIVLQLMETLAIQKFSASRIWWIPIRRHFNKLAWVDQLYSLLFSNSSNITYLNSKDKLSIKSCCYWLMELFTTCPRQRNC